MVAGAATGEAGPTFGRRAMTDASLRREESRLAEFPVAFFAIVLGLGGLALATRAAEHALGLGHGASAAALALTVLVYLVIGALYAAKAVIHPAAVAAEWRHPVRIAFFPAISISLLLVATAAAPVLPEIAHALWAGGTALQAVLTLAVVSTWIGHRPFQPMHLSPAWFIPAVGNVVVPIAGAPFGHAELSWLFFTAGILFWLVLLTLVVNRLVFHDPLPARLAPTLVILVAPPAVAFLAYLRLGGEVDAFARILINAGYVFLAIVAVQAARFLRLRFALSFWALSFPLAALSVASLVFAEETGSAVHEAVGLALFAVLLAVVAVLAVRTGLAVARREICLPE